MGTEQPPKPGRRRTWWIVALLIVLVVGGGFAYVMLGFLKALGCALLLGLPDECR